jgi:hypothetical protein
MKSPDTTPESTALPVSLPNTLLCRHSPAYPTVLRNDSHQLPYRPGKHVAIHASARLVDARDLYHASHELLGILLLQRWKSLPAPNRNILIHNSKGIDVTQGILADNAKKRMNRSSPPALRCTVQRAGQGDARMNPRRIPA